MTDDQYVGSEHRGFKVCELLGEGRFSRVYRLEHATVPTITGYALKVYHSYPQLAGNEAAALNQLKHPNIIKMYDAELSGSTPSLILEQAEKSLRAEMQDRFGKCEPKLVATNALSRIEEVLTGLTYAHSNGVIHKDLKPENILIGYDGKAKLTDFNLSKDLDATVDDILLSDVKFSKSLSGGTRGYTAPEGAKDTRSDIYSVGAILYEMLTGKLPQGRFAPASKLARTPVELDAIIDKALANDPAERYQYAHDMLGFVTKQLTAPRSTKPVASWKEFWNAEGNDRTYWSFLGKQVLKLPVNILKYTVGLPAVLAKKTYNYYHDSYCRSDHGCSIPAGFVGVVLYAAMGLGTLISADMYADGKLANELKTNARGRIVYFDPAAGRMSYANGTDLGENPSKVTTIARKLEHLVDFAPSGDGRHVYVLHRPGNKPMLTLVDLETGDAQRLLKDLDASLTPLNTANIVRALNDKHGTETLYVKSGDSWHKIKEGTLEQLTVFPPELTTALTNRSPDGAYEVAVSGDTAQVERTRGFWLFSADYRLGSVSSGTRAIWMDVPQHSVNIPQRAMDIPQTYGDLPVPEPEKPAEPPKKSASAVEHTDLQFENFGERFGPAPDVRLPVPGGVPKKPIDLKEGK